MMTLTFDLYWHTNYFCTEQRSHRFLCFGAFLTRARRIQDRRTNGRAKRLMRPKGRSHNKRKNKKSVNLNINSPAIREDAYRLSILKPNYRFIVRFILDTV